MASNAASLQPEDGSSAERTASQLGVPDAGEPPPPALVAVAEPVGPTRRARRSARTIDFERVQRLGDGNPVVVTSKLRWWVTLLIAALFIGPLALGGVAIYHALRTARDRPKVAATVAVPTKIGDEAQPTQLVAPTTAASALPLGATSLFGPGVAGALAPLLDQALPGDPTKFTSIVVHSDFAMVTMQDPTDPSTTEQQTWRPDGVTAGEVKHETVDIGPSLFTVADVDWDAVAALVAETPGLMHDADHPVDYVVVQRWGFDPAFPMRLLVYAAGGRFIEAAADGTVLAIH